MTEYELLYNGPGAHPTSKLSNPDCPGPTSTSYDLLAKIQGKKGCNDRMCAVAAALPKCVINDWAWRLYLGERGVMPEHGRPGPRWGGGMRQLGSGGWWVIFDNGTTNYSHRQSRQRNTTQGFSLPDRPAGLRGRDAPPRFSFQAAGTRYRGIEGRETNGPGGLVRGRRY